MKNYWSKKDFIIRCIVANSESLWTKFEIDMMGVMSIFYG